MEGLIPTDAARVWKSSWNMCICVDFAWVRCTLCEACEHESRGTKMCSRELSTSSFFVKSDG